MTDLLIDLGNSRVKWAQSGPGCWLPGAAVHRDHDIAGVLDQAWNELPPPKRIVLVSVAAADITGALEYWMQDRWKLAAYRVRAQRAQLGVVNSYREPETLGADRWAALLGARGITEGACVVVDCGTAVTVDALSSDGVFAGGVIFPGLELTRASLGAGTAGIGCAQGNDASVLAQATADAVAAGAAFGVAGAIERILKEQEHALGAEIEVFITGGDAPALAPRLDRPTLYMPDLVLKGLARVAEELIV